MTIWNCHSAYAKTLQDPCQKNLCISIFFCQPTFSCKSHLLEQLLTVLADPLLLVVARDVVPHLLWMYCYERVEIISFLAHRFILPKSSGKGKAALLSTQNCVWFSGGWERGLCNYFNFKLINNLNWKQSCLETHMSSASLFSALSGCLTCHFGLEHHFNPFAPAGLTPYLLAQP